MVTNRATYHILNYNQLRHSVKSSLNHVSCVGFVFNHVGYWHPVKPLGHSRGSNSWVKFVGHSRGGYKKPLKMSDLL